MNKKTIVYNRKDIFYIVDAVKTDARKEIYHNLSNDYSAANIKNDKIKLLKENETHTGIIVDVVDYVPHKIHIQGHDNYSTKVTVHIEGINDTELSKTVKFPQYSNEAKIVINDFIIKYNARGDWTSEIIDQGSTSIVCPFSKQEGYAIGFKDEISRIQLRQEQL